MSGLIERIEAASGETMRELMCEAFRAAYPEVSAGAWDAIDQWDDGYDRFTAKLDANAHIDAALMLVPIGWLVAGIYERNCQLPSWRWKAELWSPSADKNLTGMSRNADCAGPAIAAAALRARETDTPSSMGNM